MKDKEHLRMRIAIPDDYQDCVRGLACFSKLDAHETHIFYPDGTEHDLIHYFATYVVGGQTRLIEDDNFRVRSSSTDVSVRAGTVKS